MLARLEGFSQSAWGAPLAPPEKKVLEQFVDGLLDAGILVIQTAAGMLSTPMGEAEIDRLAEAVGASLRRIEWPR